MKRKNQKKYHCTRVVTLIIVFRNIYQIFRPITLFKHMLITNQYATTNDCLIKSIINNLITLLRRIFILCVFETSKLWKIRCEDLQLSCFINSFMRSKSMDWFLYDNGLRHERVKQERKIFSVMRNLFIQGNMCES